MKPCGDLWPLKSGENFAHDKCYAKELGYCSTKISGEHWISKNIQEIIEPLGFSTVGGLPWLANGELKRLPIDVAFQSKILCTDHNSALSPLDEVGGRFFEAFPSVKVRQRAHQKLHLFSGIDFERWMLKSLCGAVFSGVLRPPIGKLTDWKPPCAWLDFIFAGTHMPAPVGLYLCQKAGDRVDCQNPIEFACMAKGSDVYGMAMRLHGFLFVLAAVPPSIPVPDDSLLAGAAYRPSAFVISDSGSEIVLLFDWGPDHQGAQFNMTWSPKP